MFELNTSLSRFYNRLPKWGHTISTIYIDVTIAVLHAAVAGTLHHNDNKRFCGQLKCGAAGAMVSVEGPGAN